MTNIPIGFGQATISMRHVSGARVAAVVFGFQDSDLAVTPDDTAATINDIWNDTLGALFDGGVLGLPTVVRITDPDGELLVGTSDEGWGTSVAQESMPPNVAAMLRKRSARGGRRGQGRMFLPWVLADGDVDDVGNISSGKVSTINSAAGQLILDLATAALPMVILHDDGISAPGVPNLVGTLTVDSLVSTQRRRLGR